MFGATFLVVFPALPSTKNDGRVVGRGDEKMEVDTHNAEVGTSQARQVFAVRNATTSDWSAIWAILQPLVADGLSFTYPTDLTEHEAKRIWLCENQRVIVAVSIDDLTVGTAKMGANAVGDRLRDATASFAVAPSAQGQGIGRTLVNAALEWARQQGFAAMQFNAVFATNSRALHLYRSMGFELIRESPLTPSSAIDGSGSHFVMRCVL
jgi:GNAT superfamily N-acetyltransferase